MSPLYQYKCDTCDNEFELLQDYNADRIQTCPICGRNSHRRMSVCNNSFGFRLTEASHNAFLREKLQGGKDKIERAV